MKPEQDNSLRSLTQPMEHSLERLRPPEIVGQMENPVLEMVRRLWWRAFDCVCDCIIVVPRDPYPCPGLIAFRPI